MSRGLPAEAELFSASRRAAIAIAHRGVACRIGPSSRDSERAARRPEYAIRLARSRRVHRAYRLRARSGRSADEEHHRTEALDPSAWGAGLRRTPVPASQRPRDEPASSSQIQPVPKGHLQVELTLNTDPSQRVKVTPSHSKLVESTSVQLRQPHALAPSKRGMSRTRSVHPAPS
jgi:hypothetical protein